MTWEIFFFFSSSSHSYLLINIALLAFQDEEKKKKKLLINRLSSSLYNVPHRHLPAFLISHKAQDCCDYISIYLWIKREREAFLIHLMTFCYFNVFLLLLYIHFLMAVWQPIFYFLEICQFCYTFLLIFERYFATTIYCHNSMAHWDNFKSPFLL